MPRARRKLNVLVACELSNTVRDAFLRRGHNAYSCDLQRADYPNPYYRRHIVGDVRPLLKQSWDLVIAHPPCTYLSILSTSNWVKGVGGEGQPNSHLIRQGAMFLLECMCANAPMVCVENPRHHNYAKELIGIHADQEIQPWQFGHPYTKATRLWLIGLPKLIPTDIVMPTKGQWVYTENGGRKTAKERSITFSGIAKAMADQWW